MATAEDLWVESTRRYHERRREQRRWEWVRFFDRMAASHARISEDYTRRAEELVEEPTNTHTRVGIVGTGLTNKPTPTRENKV